METVTIKIDKEVKKVAEKQARREGVSLSDFFASTLASSVYRGANTDYRPGEKFNTKTAREIRQASKDIKMGKNLSPAFKTVAEMKKWLSK